MIRITSLISICFLLLANNVGAEQPSFKSMKPFCLPGFTTAGTVYNPGEAALKLEYIHIPYDQFYSGSSHKPSPSAGTAKITQDLVFIGFRYGISKSIDFRIHVPLVALEIEDAAGTTLATPYGVGDLGLLFRYQILNQREGSPLYMAVGLGLGAPIGETDADGVGFGAWDFYSELNFTRTFPRQRIDCELFYGMRGKGEHEGVATQKGQFFKSMLFYGVAPSHYFDLGVQIIGKVVDNDRVDFVYKEDSGGSFIDVGPVLHIKWLTHKAFFYFSPLFCIYRDVNGSQVTYDRMLHFRFKCKF